MFQCFRKKFNGISGIPSFSNAICQSFINWQANTSAVVNSASEEKTGKYCKKKLSKRRVSYLEPFTFKLLSYIKLKAPSQVPLPISLNWSSHQKTQLTDRQAFLIPRAPLGAETIFSFCYPGTFRSLLKVLIDC